MNKIVIDTNIFLSALFSKYGASFALLKYIAQEMQQERKINCVSVPTILELEEVMFRGKHKDRISYLDDGDKRGFIDDIVFISHAISLNYLWRPYLKDIKDDKILECAFNANASHIVTYNIKDFEGVEADFSIKIVTPKAYLEEKGLL